MNSPKDVETPSIWVEIEEIILDFFVMGDRNLPLSGSIRLSKVLPQKEQENK